jgi:S1-C subfamily serine protease
MTNAAFDWNDSVSAAVESAQTSVVHIEGHCGIGLSGVAWSERHVLTSHRGLGRGEDLTITLADGTTREANLVGRDPGTDVALLEVADGGLSPLEWAELDDVKVGHASLALGRPGQAIRASLRIVGVLADKVRTPRGGFLERYVETDRRLPHGFSGGPLVDLEGRGLGLNTRSIFRGADVAVPTLTLRRVVDKLTSHGSVRRGYLGVGVQRVRLPQNVRDELSRRSGALVISVADDGPAAAAGVVLGDVFVALDGEAVRGPESLRDALTERSGRQVSATILRAGALEDIELTVGERS